MNHTNWKTVVYKEEEKLNFLVAHQWSNAGFYISFYMRKIYLYLLKLLTGFLIITAEHNLKTTQYLPEL